MRLSSPVKKHLLIVMFAKSLFEIAIKYDEQDGTIPLSSEDQKRNNQNRKKNAKIDILAEKLMHLCVDVIDLVPDETKAENHEYFKRRNEHVLLPFLKSIGDTEVQLELLAIYVLYVNFCDIKDSKLAPMFEWLTDVNMYFEGIDLINDVVSKEGTEESMYNLAYKAVNDLKK